jgi:hypothetical protein
MLVSCPRIPCGGELRPLRGCALLIFPFGEGDAGLPGAGGVLGLGWYIFVAPRLRGSITYQHQRAFQTASGSRSPGPGGGFASESIARRFKK